MASGDGIEDSCLRTGKFFPSPDGWTRIPPGFVCPDCQGHKGGRIGESLESLERAKAQANRIIGALRFAGFAKCEIAGGVFKGKPNPHDIDIVVEVANEIAVAEEDLIRFSVKAGGSGIPVEIYAADSENYPRLLEALRSTRHRVIKERMFDGLRFRKFSFGGK